MNRFAVALALVSTLLSSVAFGQVPGGANTPPPPTPPSVMRPDAVPYSSPTVDNSLNPRTKAIATQDVRQLMQLMDKDMNGSVSKEEFMDFMSQTFDRLDVNKSGQLESEELQLLTKPGWVACSTFARETDGTYTCIGLLPEAGTKGTVKHKK
ncbi:MAG: hypothetical protein ACLQDM_19490 [Bradyrhizobium sp.]